MISQVLDWLFVGDDCYTKKDIQRHAISTIVGVGGDIARIYPGVECFYLKLNDGPNDPQTYDAILGFISAGKARGNTLVYCRAGMSRSPFVIALWLHRQVGMDLDDAILFVKIKHRVTNPALDMIMAYKAEWKIKEEE